MKYAVVIFLLIPVLLFSQKPAPYFKSYTTSVGTSAISVSTISARTFSFNYPVYRILPDSINRQLLLSVRQKDPSGKLYTNKGYHLVIKENDSITGLYEDTKLDFELMGDFLLMSNENKTSRFNRTLGYEQFEYPSRIVYPFRKNNSGLTYNPAFKTNGETGLSSINLNDGKVLWSAPISAKHNWNSVEALNDSVYIIAASGLHAININQGLLWSHPLSTSQKINKPVTISSFNQSTLGKMLHPFYTSTEEALLTQIASNILISGNTVYFASKDKFIAVNAEGKLVWEADLSDRPVSCCLLYDNGNEILLINLGIASFGESVVVYGKPFIAAYNKQNGTLVAERNVPDVSNISDIISIKNNKVMANRNHLVRISSGMEVQTLIELTEQKYGKFLEFINGDEYFVEKEGFYVPLNFINDNVIYFKTDHDKVFGLNSGEIEYEYHFTELYRLNQLAGSTKLISQKNKSLLISGNYELLQIFNTGEQAVSFNNKLYFADGKLLHIVNVAELK